VSAAIAAKDWDIRASGRAWKGDEAMSRFYMIERKIEMVGGKLFDHAEDRETLLCLLLENIGAERAVQFGNPDVWRSAVAKLKEQN
jgi:hypothetical protein